MATGSHAPASAFRYVPVHGSPKKVWQVTADADGSQSYYWWAVEWDLPHLSQHAGRRQSRWEVALWNAGWTDDDSTCSLLFKASDLTSQRAQQPQSHDQYGVAFFEQSIRTDALVFLLANSCSNEKGKRTACKQQLKSLGAGDFLLDSGKAVLKGEVSFGTSECMAACPLAHGCINTAVIEALCTRGQKCMRRLWAKLKPCTRDHLCTLEDALSACCEVRLSRASCKTFAALVCRALSQNWNALSSDPLFSRVLPRAAKKSNARYDPDLKNAIADALRSGPNTMQILDRVAGAYRGTTLLRTKAKPRASRLDEENLCRYLDELRALAAQHGPKSIAIAIDGGRVGGKKMLCGPIMFGSSTSLQCGWPLPQIMRDFRPSLDGSLSSIDVEECLIGLHCYLKSVLKDSGDEEDDRDSSSRAARAAEFPSANSNRVPRIASLDLGYALESWLQSAGLSLSNFTSGPQRSPSLIRIN